jgi:dihydrofolate reductase
MTKTQYYVGASADGFIADAEGGLAWLTAFDGAEGLSAHYQAFLADVQVLAMGAASYEYILREGLAAWPYPGRPTWVFTHRELPGFPGADIRFVAGDVEAEHARMVEAAGGKNIWMVGGGNLAAQFAARGLLDEIWLGVVPVVLGSGAPVLPAPIAEALELTQVTRLGRGIVELRYVIPKAGR